MTMDIWATCDPCDRSFYVPDTSVGDLTQARCPVCEATPDRFEARTEDGGFELAVAGTASEPPSPMERVVWLR